MSNDKCVTKHCRGIVALTLCDEEDQKEAKDYQFKNKLCPVCGKETTSYSYIYNADNEKVHLGCSK